MTIPFPGSGQRQRVRSGSSDDRGRRRSRTSDAQSNDTLHTPFLPVPFGYGGRQCPNQVGAAVLFVGIFIRRAFTLTVSSPLLVCWGEGRLLVRCKSIREEVQVGKGWDCGCRFTGRRFVKDFVSPGFRVD